MDTPLLTTKLYIPPVRSDPSAGLRTSLVPRPRLIERLGAALHCKLTLISAPAGFGKTTLIAAWLHAEESRQPGDGGTDGSPPRVGWLSLDDDDNDPTRFFTYFAAALETAHPDAGADTRALLASPKPPPLKSVLTLLINNLAASPGQAIVLVLDDYQAIEEEAIHEAMAFFLDHMPAKVHVIIASRVDPPLPLARLRGRGQLLELREADLRFTQDEAVAFLNQVMHLGLSSEEVGALEARTEGWIAGLQLAALSMRGHEDIPGFIAAFTGGQHYILDYLVEEVLHRQPESIQAFLLKTSILDRMTAPLCAALVGEMGDWQSELGSRTPSPASGPESQAVLEYLQHANLFLVPLDDRGEWYRYHRLFADFLHSHLYQDMPDQIPTLHRRAADWYARHELVSEAIGHALEAGDFNWAADLIEGAVEATMMRSEIATLGSWVEALPEDIVHAHPRLCVYHAWTLLLSGHPLEAAETRLRQAEGADTSDTVAGEITLFRALIATYQGDTRRSAELAQQALELLPEGSLFLRSLIAGFLGVSYLWSGEITAARRALDEAARISRQAGNLMNAVLALCHLAEVSLLQAQLHQAQAFYNQALGLAVDDQGRRRPIAGLALIGLGGLLREWNDLESAERHLEEGIELITKWGEVGGITGYGQLARLKQSQGDLDGAHQAIQRAGQIARSFDAMELDDRLVDVYQVQIWIAGGDLEAAARWGEERGLRGDAGFDELEKWTTGAPLPLGRAIEYLTLAEVYIAQDRPDAALQVLDPILRGADAAGWTAFVLQSLTLQALALQGQGDTSQAISALKQALALAEPAGFVRVFLDQGQPMARLLQKAASRGIAPEHTAKLLEAFEPETKNEGRRTQEALPPAGVRPGLIEPLSERELEVLRLIAAGLSNREIAQELVVAISTVKTHINNIYRKLDVSKRTQAVARARELELL
jgi:LuxR family maltose regulon positive regulatory protein